jgi:RNA recognition motif-containing protein
MNIYIENLEGTIDNEHLKQLFAPFGDVTSAEVIKDDFTGLSRGYGYVEMEDNAAQAAISQLNQSTVQNLQIKVEEAPPKKIQKGSYKVGNGAVNVYRFRKN